MVFTVLFMVHAVAQLSTNKEKTRLLYKKKPVDNKTYSYISIDKEKKYAIVGFDSLDKTFYGCYNFNGENILPVRFSEINTETIEKNPFFQVSREVSQGKYLFGMYNRDGKCIVPEIYSGIETMWYDNHIFMIHGFIADSTDRYIQGVYNINGLQILPPIYSSVNVIFDEATKRSFIQVQKDSLQGITDIDGKTIVPTNYQKIELLIIENVNDETYFLAEKDNFFYLYNSRGKLLTDAGHHQISIGFCGGHRLFTTTKVLPNGKRRYGFADRITGKQITPEIYNEYALISKDLFRAKLDSSWGLIDLQGENLKPLYSNILCYGDSGTCGVVKHENDRMSIYLPREKRFLEGNYDSYDENWPYLVLTQDSCKEHPLQHQLYHIELHQLLNETFSDYEFSLLKNNKVGKNQSLPSTKVLPIITNGQDWFLIQNLSKTRIPGKFEKCKAINNALFIVKINQKYGLVNIDGQIILPAEYDDIFDYSSGDIQIKKNNLYGMCNERGKIIIPTEYAESFAFRNDRSQVKKGTEYFYINRKNKRLEN